MTLLDTRPDLDVTPGTVVNVPIHFILNEMICGDHEDLYCNTECIENDVEEYEKWDCVLADKTDELSDEFIDRVASTPDVVIGYYTNDYDGFIYRDGHHRLAAAISLGWSYVNIKCIPYAAYGHDIESA